MFIVATATAAADEPETVARRFVAQIYDGNFAALPTAAGARFAAFERRVRNVLRVRCVRVEAIDLAPVERKEDRITVDADVAIEKRERAAARPWSASEIVPLRIVVVRDGAAWRVAEVEDRDDELAGRLLRAAAGDREQLLREEPRRVGPRLGRALHARAIASLNAGNFPAAADAAAMAGRVAAAAGDRGGQALALGAAAYTANRNVPASPETLAMESLAIARTLEEPDVLARAWYDLGRQLRSPSSQPSSIDCYLEARKYAERAEDPMVLARVLYSLANIAANAQTDYLSARRYIDEGLALTREIGDRSGEMSFEMVLSTLYFGQGDFDRGLFHHHRATNLAEQLGSYAYPTLLVRSGCLLVDAGRFAEARRTFDRILIRNEKGLTVKFGSAPSGTIDSALRCLAVLELHEGNFDEAECLSRESANLGTAPKTYRYELAPYYLEARNDKAALAAALASLETDLFRDQRVAALAAASRAYRNLGFPEHALTAALEAIELREAIDANVAGDEQQRALAARTTTECYELAAELTLVRGDASGALSYLERGRARVLRDILDNGRTSMARADAELRNQQAALDRDVARLGHDLDKALAAHRTGAAAELRDRMNRARAVRATFVDGVLARSDRRRAARGSDAGVAAGVLARRLPPGTAAVEYLLGEHDLYVFVLRGDGVTVRTRHVERAAVERRINEFLERLVLGDLRVELLGRELYTLLLAPVEKEIAFAEALLVVPDDFLWRLPFAALVDQRGRFLVERKAVVYAPSIIAYASIADLRRRRKPRPMSLLAVGNPTLDSIASKAAASLYRDATFGPLPDAEHEVDAMRRLYGSSRSVVLKRDQATETRTKRALHEATIAHFATHAILDDTNPMYSRLMLARDRQSADDGSLDAWEVARLDLDADLVVLSACDTARGRVGGGEGVVGLSWSFFLAGASSTVATQWKVASDSTARFMIAFHRALRAPAADPALHKALSLRAAQLQLIRDKHTRHPFYWAPFVLLGDPGLRDGEAARR